VLSVITWYWHQPGGRTRYQPLHVAIWRDMIERNLSIPHRLACVTDEPIQIEGVEIISPPRDFEEVRLPTWPEHRPQCLRRLSMFGPDAGEVFGEEILCTDLDLVVGAPLDPMLGGAADFRMAVGTAPGRPYNGSLLYLRAGARRQVYDEFTPGRAAEAGRRFVGSDQAWIAQCLGPNEATWGEADGLVYHGLPRSPDTERRIMFFPGAEKPWMRVRDPWVERHYRRSPQGRCLILGYDSNLWRDVERALDDGPYDAVIASPEAAEHWTGEILAVARDNAEAARLARMHGFDDVTWCGVRKREAA
jgi:hypothetical protein